ncbi:biopolymer transporter ExbD [Sulfuriflexus mobilis]|uniref:biopolymer transporter ExbD n=1 Tax=Sulfuriflexus mobilis TaxID=1811807 RepID=UPI000F825D12|nr:biopolymer transporter ExbD [Sulfuriflexus mobilis]
MKRFDSINVIPFIDIMLVLLAIVLTTASFIAQGQIAIELPVAKAAAVKSDTSAIEIGIDRLQIIYFNQASIDLDGLQQRLAVTRKDKPIILRVDASVPFETFVAVVDILKAENLQQLTIQTRRTP